MRWLIGIGLAAALVAGGFFLGQQNAHRDVAQAPVATDGGRKVLYWHDPMVPRHKFDKPGKSPFMDMQLVPVYADEAAGRGGVSDQSRDGSRTSAFARASAEGLQLASSSNAVGTSQAERAPTGASCSRASAARSRSCSCARRSIRCAQGQPLVTIFAPEWSRRRPNTCSRAAWRRRTPGCRDCSGGAANACDSARTGRRLVENIGEAEVGAVAECTLISPISGVVSRAGRARRRRWCSPAWLLFRMIDLSIGLGRGERARSAGGAADTGAPRAGQVRRVSGANLFGKVARIPAANRRRDAHRCALASSSESRHGAEARHVRQRHAGFSRRASAGRARRKR